MSFFDGRVFGLGNVFGMIRQGRNLGFDTKVDVYPQGYTPRNTRLKGERDKREEKWKLCKAKNKIG